MPTTTGKTGFSVIEMVISVSIVGILLSSIFFAGQRGIALFETGSVNNDVNSRAGRTMARIVREMIGADVPVADPALEPPFGTSEIDYRYPLGVAGGAPVWSTPTRLTLELAEGELDNGVDDNGNDLVDERSIVMIRELGSADEQRVVLANGISELLEGEIANMADDNGNGLIDEEGLNFVLVADVLFIRLSVERINADGRRVVRTLEDAIALRN